MNNIYATALVSSTDPAAFQRTLDAEVAKWQRQGKGLVVEAQLSTSTEACGGSGSRFTRYSALLIVRRPA